MSNHDGVSGPGGQHPWTDDQAGWTSDVDRRTAPLRRAAFWGLIAAVLLMALGAVWPVSFVLGVVAFFWAGIAGIAYWVCRALLPQEDAS